MIDLIKNTDIEPSNSLTKKIQILKYKIPNMYTK